MTDNVAIQHVAAQVNMDSFSARGLINIPITNSPFLNDQNINNTKIVSDLLTNSNNLIESDSSKSLPSLQGQWAFEVNKGEVESFRVIFTIVQNDKIVNALDFLILQIQNIYS